MKRAVALPDNPAVAPAAGGSGDRVSDPGAIPVVMAASADPIGEGLSAGLRHPGGNITGLSLQEIDTAGKRLELLEELLPGTAPVALLWTNVSRNSLRYLKTAETAARAHGWKVLNLEIRSADAIESAFKAAIDAHAGGLLDLAIRLTFARARDVATFAAKARLPVMYDLRDYVEAGGLIAYGPDLDDIWRRAAVFVDKILKGANPAGGLRGPDDNRTGPTRDGDDVGTAVMTL